MCLFHENKFVVPLSLHQNLPNKLLCIFFFKYNIFSCSELKKLTSANRLILSGTPLQNNLTELWSLLNYLLPQFFDDKNTFESLLQLEDFDKTEKIIEQEKNNPIISTIHGVLKPFMLRRLKSDVWEDMVPKKEVLVYCPLSELQSDLYRCVLTKNVTKLLGQEVIIFDVLSMDVK